MKQTSFKNAWSASADTPGVKRAPNTASFVRCKSRCDCSINDPIQIHTNSMTKTCESASRLRFERQCECRIAPCCRSWRPRGSAFLSPGARRKEPRVHRTSRPRPAGSRGPSGPLRALSSCQSVVIAARDAEREGGDDALAAPVLAAGARAATRLGRRAFARGRRGRPRGESAEQTRGRFQCAGRCPRANSISDERINACRDRRPCPVAAVRGLKDESGLGALCLLRARRAASAFCVQDRRVGCEQPRARACVSIRVCVWINKMGEELCGD